MTVTGILDVEIMDPVENMNIGGNKVSCQCTASSEDYDRFGRKGSFLVPRAV